MFEGSKKWIRDDKYNGFWVELWCVFVLEPLSLSLVCVLLFLKKKIKNKKWIRDEGLESFAPIGYLDGWYKYNTTCKIYLEDFKCD